MRWYQLEKWPWLVACPAIHSGDFCLAGTRVPASRVLEYRSDALSLDEFLVDFPTVDARFAALAWRMAENDLAEAISIGERLREKHRGPLDAENAWEALRPIDREALTELHRWIEAWLTNAPHGLTEPAPAE